MKILSTRVLINMFSSLKAFFDLFISVNSAIGSSETRFVLEEMIRSSAGNQPGD